jgi:hypothetical protein
MNKTKALLLAALLSLVLACNLITLPTGGTTPVGESNQPANPTEIPTSEPASIPSSPVGIQAGLASLNTYFMTVESHLTGPTQADYSNTSFEITNSNDPDANSTHYVTAESSADSSEPSQTESYSYAIGNASCSGSDADGWDYSESTPQQAEMQKLLAEMMDFMPIIDNPTFVGSETMNGIQTNHFTFQIGGLGLQSSAQVVANQGDYWLAQDGQYIVKYSLVTETLDPTTQTTMHMDVTINLNNVNQPVNIAFPAGCAK